MASYHGCNKVAEKAMRMSVIGEDSRDEFGHYKEKKKKSNAFLLHHSLSLGNEESFNVLLSESFLCVVDSCKPRIHRGRRRVTIIFHHRSCWRKTNQASNKLKPEMRENPWNSRKSKMKL
ncbi:hypothetical protein ISN45_Aa03g006420 [Arabidopsis thaliana x Arabidopsis arenosa]|uniref:Uncharacterized protein n=1 Tax=Arabidopsis thaliana x Arabidopsis arenosa TaxID=1240361 RepID=A0A8T2AQD3_9BRAS|nr:hypothetical protein ISN45_Aa03g006420 [Arabidopsis thaliana x Arabidopsis arenosa]